MIRRWSAFFLVGALAAGLLVLSASWVGQAQAFDVNAKAALLMDADTGQILFEKNADEPMHPASLVKIMTILVIMDNVKAGRLSLDEEVTTSRRASRMGGSQVYLAEGEVHTLEEMLKAVSIASGNDASVAVAEHLAGTEAAFVGLMNERARELGMVNTVFTNADGLPPGPGESPSLTTARDIAIAARELITEHPRVLEWTSTVSEKFRDDPLFILYNTNKLLGEYDGLDGLKTGYTSTAGFNLVATAKRGDVRLISVVMGTESESIRSDMTRVLLDHGFNRFAPVEVGSDVVGQLKLASGTPERFDVRVTKPVRVLKPRGEDVEVAAKLRPAGNLEAPIAEGEVVGEYVVTMAGDEILRVPVVSAADVKKANIAVRLWRTARDFVVGLFGS